MTTVYLKPNREKSVLNRHPWIFTGAVSRVEGTPQSGDEVRVVSAAGKFLARGFFSATSQICCRLLRWEDMAVDQDFLATKIRQAEHLRSGQIAKDTDAYRIVNAEGDGLPGLVVDRYGDLLVVQFSNAGIENWRTQIVAILEELFSPLAIYEKSDGGARAEEVLPARAGVLSGDFNSGAVRIFENGLRYFVDVAGGQKTGFYLDQRENRRFVSGFVAEKKVLNGFAYTGGFTVSALAGGAQSVVSVDSSRHAIELAGKNVRENGFSQPAENFVVADVFDYLRQTDQEFDFIVLDPPALAKHRRDVNNAARAYKDVNMHALERLRPGGMLFTCSCSQHISPDLFQKILFAAATDSQRNVTIAAERSHPIDHPISIYHPEGRYLHAFLLAVTS